MSSEEDAGFKVVHAQDPEANAAFPPNLVKTSRYNPVTFVPIFLLEQLNPRNKFANFYFFCVAMLQMVPSISITGGLPSVLVPLLFVLFVEVRQPQPGPRPRESVPRWMLYRVAATAVASGPAAGRAAAHIHPHPHCLSRRA